MKEDEETNWVVEKIYLAGAAEMHCGLGGCVETKDWTGSI